MGVEDILAILEKVWRLHLLDPLQIANAFMPHLSTTIILGSGICLPSIASNKVYFTGTN